MLYIMGMISPAEHTIKQFGGVRALARALGRYPSTISRWQKSRDVDGCEGRVPTSVQRKILEIARERGLDITPNDLVLGRASSPTESEIA